MRIRAAPGNEQVIRKNAHMRITIQEGFAGALYRRGVFVRVLNPGRHRYSYLRGESVQSCDMRVRSTVGYGNILTTDKINVTVTTPFSYVVADLRVYFGTVTEINEIIRVIASNSIVRAAGNNDLEGLEASFGDFADAFMRIAKDDLRQHGIELRDVYTSSILVPKNIRNASEAQLAAKKKALADLEEARGRTAVLRHYANASELIKEKPEILQLMLGQKAKNISIDFSKQK